MSLGHILSKSDKPVLTLTVDLSHYIFFWSKLAKFVFHVVKSSEIELIYGRKSGSLYKVV